MKILISACLLGSCCRYDGASKAHPLAAALAERDKAGYLLTNERMETATPGFFAAGDCRQKTVRQLTTAVSDGTLAAVAACEWLAEQKTKRAAQNGRAHAAR